MTVEFKLKTKIFYWYVFITCISSMRTTSVEGTMHRKCLRYIHKTQFLEIAICLWRPNYTNGLCLRRRNAFQRKENKLAQVNNISFVDKTCTWRDRNICCAMIHHTAVHVSVSSLVCVSMWQLQSINDRKSSGRLQSFDLVQKYQPTGAKFFFLLV